jgi:hypothetical protein
VIRPYLLKLLGAFSIFLGLAGCSHTQKSSAQIWQETIAQADMLIAVDRAFAKSHQLAGTTTDGAIGLLEAEGFQCGLQYKMLPALEKNSLDHFIVENVPMIYCSKLHAKTGENDPCRKMWAAFEINWIDPTRPPEILKQEYGTSTIKKEMYFCRVSEDKK